VFSRPSPWDGFSRFYHFSRLRAQGRLRDIPIFLDSPMAINASGLMCDFMDEHRLARAECEAACSVAHYVREVEESKELTANPAPKVIISASGMATGGRVLHHPSASRRMGRTSSSSQASRRRAPAAPP
jgi:metallo-beta-lactamase family protein